MYFAIIYGFLLVISAMFMALMACNCSLALASGSRQNMHVSAISAAPAILPGDPLVSTNPSPDIEPLFPTTPGGVAYSPAVSSLPTIPSSPSPPNPDVLGTPGPVLAFPPLESMPASALASQGTSQPWYSISYLALLVICIMQLHGV